MYQNEKFNCKQNNLIINFQKLIFNNMKTPKQIVKEWSFSTNNSDNIKKKSEDETLVEEESYSNIRDEILESNSCSSCCLSKNMIENLKERLEKLEEIQKINSEHQNEIENLKQNFQKLIEENNQKLKGESDEKINFLEKEIKKAHDLINKKFSDLTIKCNPRCVYANFVEVKNKWKEINSGWKCCANNCINTNKPIGNCINGNGFVNLIDDGNIKYLVGNGGCDQVALVYAENSFKKPQNSFNYSLYYFEVKCIFEEGLNGSKSYMNIGLKNCSTTNFIRYTAKDGEIYNKGVYIQLSTFSWNNNDVLGCGLVYPPISMTNEFPYVFFTQNGKQIGKGIKLENNFDLYKPRVFLNCCSFEANFGNDLETKPFNYDISKHLILKEFF